MSALGQKQIFAPQNITPALPPKAIQCATAGYPLRAKSGHLCSAKERVGCLRKRTLTGNKQKIYAVFRIPDDHDGFAGSSRIWSSASFSSARTASDRLRIRFSNRKSSIAAISSLVSRI